MPQSVSLSEARDALRELFGGTLEQDHDDGREMMIDALQARFALSPAAAFRLVEELENAGEIAWVPTEFAPIEAETETGPAAVEVPAGTGHWSLYPL